MKKKNNKKIFIRLYISVAILLAFFWLIASVISFNKVSFSVVTLPTKNTHVSQPGSIDVYGKEALRGEFKAKDNYLGLVILELNSFKQPKTREDTITFKIKEKGRNKWDFQREYRSGLFDSQSDFSFGFPVIDNSIHKTYEFEISSTASKNKKLSLKANNFITGYQYPKSEIVKGEVTVRFIVNKLQGFFSNPEFVFKSIIYLYPLILFLLIAPFLKYFMTRKTFSKKSNLKFVFPVLILLVIFLPRDFYIPGFYIALLLWFVTVMVLKLKSNISFIISFILILLWIAIIPFGMREIQSKLNEVCYMFLFFGCIQLLLEERRNIEK